MHAFLLCHGHLSNAPVSDKNVRFVQLWFDCLIYAFRFLSGSEVTMFFFLIANNKLSCFSVSPWIYDGA